MGNQCLIGGTLTSKKQERGRRQQINFSFLSSFHSESLYRFFEDKLVTQTLAVLSYEVRVEFHKYRMKVRVTGQKREGWWALTIWWIW